MRAPSRSVVSPASLVLVVVAAAAAAAALAGCGGGCVDRGDGDPGAQIDRGFIQDNLLTEPPAAIGQPLHATFTAPGGGGKVVYLGSDVATTSLAPGDKVLVTHYWQVIEPPADGWKVFSHLRGEGDEFMNVDLTDMRTGHPPPRWQAGQIVRDPQTFVLRKDWRSPTATLVVGFYPKGKHTVADRMAIEAAGGAPDDRALPVARFSVDVSKAPPPPGTLILPKARGPIVIDGRADEPAWQGAAVQTSFSSAEGCPELADETSARMTWDDEHLYLFVSSEDSDVHSPFTAHDDKLWEADVVEVFVDADKNGRGYIELQVSPRNVQFDTWFAGNRPHRDDAFQAGMTSAVVVRGTLDDRDDGDAGWDVELAIPHAAVRGKDPGMRVAIPPRPGDTWRLNVVRVDKARDGQVRASSWNRITCQDFHALDRMLTVQFADADGRTEPAPAPEPAPGPASDPAAAPGEPAPPQAPPPGAGEPTPRDPAAAPRDPAAAPRGLGERPAPGATIQRR